MGELIRMHLERQSKSPGSLEDAAGFLHGERAVLAKNVTVLGTASLGDNRQHFVDDQVEIPRSVILELFGDGMRA